MVGVDAQRKFIVDGGFANSKYCFGCNEEFLIGLDNLIRRK